jgi:hypothetical protein
LRYTIVVPALILLGAALRVGFAIFVHPLGGSLYSDMANYVRVASDIVMGTWRVEDFFQPIGFPLLIAGLMKTTDGWLLVVAWINVLASTATIGLVWYLATQSFGRTVGLVSLGVAALHLPWIVFSGFAMPETLFSCCLALMGLVTWRFSENLRVRDGLLWGACFSLGLLLKGTHTFLVILLALLLLTRHGAAARRGLAAIFVVVLASLIAHGSLSLATTGNFQVTPSASGLNLVEGKCPSKDNEDSTGSRWLSPLYLQLDRTEHKVWDHPFTDSRYFLLAGLACVIADPWTLVRSVEGIPFLFVGNWLWPRGSIPFDDYLRLYEMMFSLWAVIGLVAVLLLSGDAMRSTRMVATWVMPVVALFLCVYVFKSEIRFRIPFDVWIIPLATAGWRSLWRARNGQLNTPDGDSPSAQTHQRR